MTRFFIVIFLYWSITLLQKNLHRISTHLELSQNEHIHVISTKIRKYYQYPRKPAFMCLSSHYLPLYLTMSFTFVYILYTLFKWNHVVWAHLCVFLFIQLHEILPCCYQLVIDCSCSLLYSVTLCVYTTVLKSFLVLGTLR